MNWRNSKVLVTGGAGFIGSELVSQLIAAGARVVVVDNLVSGKLENLSGLPTESCRLEKADIRDGVRMQALLAGVDVVFHLACLGVRHSIHSPVENHEVNAAGTLNLLKISREVGVGRFVHISSSEVYGTAMHVPISEGHPTFPHTVYGASKLAGECYARAFWKTYGLPVVVIRPFNSYGFRCHHEGDSGEVIPKFLLRAMTGKPLLVFGSGEQTRDFTFVSDTARGIILAAESEDVMGETINLGYGQEISINELAKVVAEVAGKSNAVIEHVAARPGDVLRLLADTSKAQTLLKYEPRINFREGMERLKQWYLNMHLPLEQLLADEQSINWSKK